MKSLNGNGTVAAGIFAPYPIVKINDYGLFRWPLAGQPELLSPHLNPAGLQGPVEISSDGNKIWFFCNSTYGTGYCPVTVPKPKPWVAEIWSQNRGFTLANADLSGRFNYVTPLGNGDTSIAGVIGTSDFGLVGPNGQFTPLSGFPSDLDPKNYVFIANSAVTLIALVRSAASNIFPKRMLWNALGVSLLVPKAPAPCPHFPVNISAIDDSGAIFASAFCPALAGESVDSDIDLRISSTGPQTLGDWLRSRGVANDLPASASVTLVSDNGRTVYGQTADLFGIGGAATTTSPHANCHDTVCQFLANVP